jgi:hypothetical protein
MTGLHHLTITENALRATSATCETIFKKVKAHSGDRWNDDVDLRAKAAIELPSQMPDCPLEVLHNPHNYLLHDDGVVIEQYPSAYIKQNFQTQQQEITNHKITETFNERFLAEDGTFANARWKLNLRKTKKLASSKHLMNNYIDASPMFQHKFRTQNITDNLTFFDQRVQRKQEVDGTCPLCNNDPDVKNHMWSCQQSLNMLPAIIATFIANFHIATRGKKDYLPIKEIRKNIPENLASKIDLNSPEALHNPWMQGFVTDIDRNALQNEYQTLTLKQANNLQFDLMEAWQKSIYTHLWTPRVEIISERIKARKQETLNSQREANRLIRGRGRGGNNLNLEEGPARDGAG